MFDLFASLIITPGVRASLQMTSGGNAKINMIQKKFKWTVSKLDLVQNPTNVPPRSPEQNEAVNRHHMALGGGDRITHFIGELNYKPASRYSHEKCDPKPVADNVTVDILCSPFV